MASSVKDKTATRAKKIKPRVKRILDHRAPKLFENIKTALFLKAEKTSSVTSALLNELCMLKKPNSIKFNKKNKIRPFEDSTSLEFLSQKNDASFILIASHSKKRPDNLFLVRLFDYQILNIVEFHVTNFSSIHEFKNPKQQASIGAKPCFLLQGDEFDTNSDFKILSNMFIDLFRGQVLSEINLAALSHVFVLTASASVIHFRHYAILLKKSQQKVLPRVELEEIGPRFDITIRRTKHASSDLWKAALKQPKKKSKKATKNTSTNVFGDSQGRIHMPRQPLSSLSVRRMKGLKKMKKRPLEVDSSTTTTTTSQSTTARPKKKSKFN